MARLVKHYKTSEFAKLVGVSTKTLERWEKNGKLVPNRTDTNRRIYTDFHHQKALEILGIANES